MRTFRNLSPLGIGFREGHPHSVSAKQMCALTSGVEDSAPAQVVGMSLTELCG